MELLSDLEAALAASFDREHLSVCGDYLHSIGDPRGELIAIDLAGHSEDRAARKRELVEAWLGADLAALLHVAGAIDRGFLALRVTGAHTEAAVRLLTSAAGAHLHRLAIANLTGLSMHFILNAVVSAPHRWLRELDLSGCEPGESVFPALADLPWRAQLTSMRLPSLRRDADVVALERALATMRGDAEIAVARAYARHAPALAIPDRVAVPAPFPWPPPDTLAGARLAIEIPGDPVGETLSLAPTIAAVEDAYATMDAATREVWTELFATAHENQHFGFSADSLAGALAAMDLAGRPELAHLRVALVHRSGDRLRFSWEP